MHFFKSHIFGIILGIILAVPTVTLGGSFVNSLIQGKTPSEAVVIIGEQLDSLFGRVSNLETEQVTTNLEIEKLKLENENLRLKAEQISDQTKQIRANEDRKTRCSSLASQINQKEEQVRQPFEERIRPLNTELRQLMTQKSQGDSFTPESFNELKTKIEAKRKEIDVINLEMEKAVDSLRETTEMKALLNELNNILLCA